MGGVRVRGISLQYGSQHQCSCPLEPTRRDASCQSQRWCMSGGCSSRTGSHLATVGGDGWGIWGVSGSMHEICGNRHLCLITKLGHSKMELCVRQRQEQNTPNIVDANNVKTMSIGQSQARAGQLDGFRETVRLLRDSGRAVNTARLLGERL